MVRSAAPLESARAWTTVGAAFVSMFVVFGVGYSFGAFFAPMAQEFSAGSGATSLFFSITSATWFVLGAGSGWAVDRVGPRPVLLVGAAALGAGLLLTARVDSLELGYLTYGLGVGIGVACGYVPMVAVVGGWFEGRRAVALGVAVTGIGLGTLTVAPLAALLVDQLGWRRTFELFGVTGAALLVGCALVAAPPPVRTGGGAPPRLADVVRSRPFRAVYASALLTSSALFLPFVFLPAFAQSQGAGRVPAAALVGLIGLASVAGRLATGAVAARVGVLRSYRGCTATMAASFALWLVAGWVGPAYPVLVAFTVVLGVGYGGWVALGPAVVAELFGVRGLGALVGLTYTAAAVGSLVGPPLAGWVLDATGSHRWAVGGALLLGAGATLVLRRLPS